MAAWPIWRQLESPVRVVAENSVEMSAAECKSQGCGCDVVEHQSCGTQSTESVVKDTKHNVRRTADQVRSQLLRCTE